MRKTYWFQGVQRECVRVWFSCHGEGFIVRRHTSTGYVTGHLTDRNGWGGPHLAQLFPTAQAAADAIGTRVRFFAILHNQRKAKTA